MSIDLFADLTTIKKNGKNNQRILHPQYLNLQHSALYGPARDLIRKIQEDLHDPDGNFVEQFQTTGFDSRTFEIFLFAMLQAAGHTINRNHKRPDFLISKDGITAAIEAVTANPKNSNGVKPYFAIPNFKTVEEIEHYIKHEVPVRMGSPLFTKLQMRYWDLPHVKGKPLIIAIEDFHSDGSLTTSSSILSNYLYGSTQHWYHDEEGKLIITEQPLTSHKAEKEIPSGFFNQPEAEYISAVLFCNSGTIPKFNRMGHQGEFHSNAVRMLRHGTCHKHDPNATLPDFFFYEVGDPESGPEAWNEGTVLIHNPNALHPIPADWFGAAAEETFENGRHITTFAYPLIFFPYMSLTTYFRSDTPPHVVEEFYNVVARHFSAHFA